MAAFKFKFESLQNVKKNLEKKAQKELASIDNKISNLNEFKSELKAELKNHRLSTDNNKKMSDIRFLKDYKNLLEAKIKMVDAQLSKLNFEREKKVEELIQKSKEHKIFDKMEEIHIEKFNKMQNKIEMKNTDELAIQKFARINK